MYYFWSIGMELEEFAKFLAPYLKVKDSLGMTNFVLCLSILVQVIQFTNVTFILLTGRENFCRTC